MDVRVGVLFLMAWTIRVGDDLALVIESGHQANRLISADWCARLCSDVSGTAKSWSYVSTGVGASGTTSAVMGHHEPSVLAHRALP